MKERSEISVFIPYPSSFDFARLPLNFLTSLPRSAYFVTDEMPSGVV